MNRTFISLAALALLASPAAALTLEQAQNELGSMSCSGSSCSSSETISSTIQHPDTVTSTEVLVSPAVDGTDGSFSSAPPNPNRSGWWNARCKTFASVNADCTVNSISPGGNSGTPAIYRTETVVTPGGTTVVTTCETTTKTLTYNGPFTSRDGAWSIDSSTSSSDGGC